MEGNHLAKNVYQGAEHLMKKPVVANINICLPKQTPERKRLEQDRRGTDKQVTSRPRPTQLWPSVFISLYLLVRNVMDEATAGKDAISDLCAAPLRWFGGNLGG